MSNQKTTNDKTNINPYTILNQLSETPQENRSSSQALKKNTNGLRSKLGMNQKKLEFSSSEAKQLGQLFFYQNKQDKKNQLYQNIALLLRYYKKKKQQSKINCQKNYTDSKSTKESNIPELVQQTLKILYDNQDTTKNQMIKSYIIQLVKKMKVNPQLKSSIESDQRISQFSPQIKNSLDKQLKLEQNTNPIKQLFEKIKKQENIKGLLNNNVEQEKSINKNTNFSSLQSYFNLMQLQQKSQNQQPEKKIQRQTNKQSILINNQTSKQKNSQNVNNLFTNIMRSEEVTSQPEQHENESPLLLLMKNVNNGNLQNLKNQLEISQEGQDKNEEKKISKNQQNIIKQILASNIDGQKGKLDMSQQSKQENLTNFFDPDDLYLNEKIRIFLKEKTKYYTNVLINQQMSDEQMKVAFSEQILKTILGHKKVGTIIPMERQVEDKHPNHSHPSHQQQVQDENLKYLKFVENCLKQSLKYLKIVYPRNTKMQARNELIDQIKDIDLTNLDQFDIMIQTNTVFTYANEQFDSGIEILDQIKLFLQKINKQAKKGYPKFEHILKEIIPKYIKMITIEDKRLFQGNIQEASIPLRHSQSIIQIKQQFPIQQKDQEYMETISDPHKFKIGKKLSPDDKHFESVGSERLKIRTNQLFRLITKWTEDLMSILDKFTTNNQGFQVKKFRITPDGKYQFENHFFRLEYHKESEQCKSLLHLKDKIQKNVFNKREEELRKSWVEMLKIVENNKRFGELDRDEKKMLSFSKKTYEMNRQFLEEQLIYLIKSLTQARYNMNKQWQPSIKNIDFVRFKVTDMLRARIMVDQKLLMDVYKALVRMDEAQIIKIVKIKNRFKTPMSDALIVFKMVGDYNSPILCEFQLILYKKQGDNNKEKAYETINHFLYEMQRSTYGPLSQLALLVALKDPKIEYLKLIPLNKKQYKNSCFCKNSKFKQSQKSKKNFRNFTIIYSQQDQCIDTKHLKDLQSQTFTCSRCEETFGKSENLFPIKSCICGYKICAQCIIEQEPEIYKEMIQKIMNNILLARSEDGNFYQFEFGNDKMPKNIIDCDQKIVIFTKKSKKNTFWKQFETHLFQNHQRDRHVMRSGVLLRLSKFFNKEQKPFFVYRIQKDADNDNISFTIDNSQEMEKFTIQKMVDVSTFDTFVFFKDFTKILDKTKSLNQLSKKSIANNLIRNCLFRSIKQTQQQKVEVQIYSKLKKQLKNNFSITLSLIENHINDFEFLKRSPIFSENIENIKRIKLVNLQNNQIKSLDNIFMVFQDMEELYLDNNYIQQFQIEDTLQYPGLQTLSLRGNHVSYLKIVNHKHIVHLYMNRNDSMSTQNKFILKNNPKLLTLHLAELQPKSLTLQLQKLERMQLFNFANYQILNSQNSIYSFKSLEEIYLNNTNIKVSCESRRIRKIYLMKASNIQFIQSRQTSSKFDMSWDLSHLDNLLVLQLREIERVKLLQLPKNLKLITIENIQDFETPLKLSNMNLENVYFKNMPLQQFTFLPKMKQIFIENVNKFELISQEDGGSKNLNSLYIKGLDLDQQKLKCLKIKSQNLVQLNLPKNKIKTLIFLTKISIKSVKTLNLQSNCIQVSENQLIQAKFDQLKMFNLNSNQLNSMKFLESMQLNALQQLNMEFNCVSHGQQSPNFNIYLNKLITLNLNSNKLTSIKFLEGMHLGSLITLLLDDNYISHNDNTIVKTQLKSLQTLSLFSNKISSLKFLQGMRLQSLLNLQLASNQIRHDQLSQLKILLPSLKKLNLQYNQITSLHFLEKMQMNSLLELNLQNNVISHDENTNLFITLPNLHRLKLSNNNIVSLKFLDGMYLKSLCELQLHGGNPIMDHQNSKFMIDLPRLQKLNLSEKCITSLNFLKGMKLDSLTYFHLQKNKIYHDMDSILHIKLRNVQKLNLSENCITSLKFLEGMDLQSLIVLKLWKNQIWHDDNVFLDIKLKNLRRLNLSSNKLTSLRFLEGMKMDSLQSLFLWNNKIAHDDKAILSIQLESLQSLNLQSNKITSLKFLQGIKLNSLAQLNLNLNKLTYNQKTSLNVKLRQLKCLLLYGNQLQSLNILLKIKMNNINTLNLGCNQIVADETTKIELEYKNLKKLVLNRNKIKSMNFLKYITTDHNIVLELQMNNIKHFQLNPFYKIQQLLISHNQFENLKKDVDIIIQQKDNYEIMMNQLKCIQIDSDLAKQLQALSKVFPSLIVKPIVIKKVEKIMQQQ